jgi:hypothetical protein
MTTACTVNIIAADISCHLGAKLGETELPFCTSCSVSYA